MFETITSSEERGQVGIGTLIIFIAMVLVAAIAAGVLINTAGVLQSQASDTGSDTQEAVANQIEVIHAVGEVGGPDAKNLSVDTVNLTIKQSAGAGAIDLTSMTVQYTSDNASVTLVHGGNDVDAFTGNEEFVTNGVDGYNDDSLTNTQERVVVTLDVAGIENGEATGTAGAGLEGGSSAMLELVDQSGASYTYGVSVPSTFGDANVVLV